MTSNPSIDPFSHREVHKSPPRPSGAPKTHGPGWSKAGHTCQVYAPQSDSKEDKNFICNAPAHHRIKVGNKALKAFAYVCDSHREIMNDEYARIRVEGNENP